MIFIKTLEKMLKLGLKTWNYEPHRPLPKGKNKKVIGITKDELGGKIMIKFVGLKAET